MTIEVTITNDDVTRSLIVEAIERDKDSTNKYTAHQESIRPGHTATFHVHMLRDLLVREKLP